MDNRIKNVLYAAVLLAFMAGVYYYRQNSIPTPFRLEGKTMGTSYHIIYFDERNRNFQHPVDSLLELINKAINTYDTTADISRFNRSDHGVHFTLPYFYPPLLKSQEVVKGSGGAYDPTVMPLVNAWGFGPRKVERPDTAEVMRVKEYVGFEKIQFNKDSAWKLDPRVQLDFSAIGQGYGADVIGDFFKSREIIDYFIELGGEGVAHGRNLKENRDWEIGILDPESNYEEQKFIATTRIRDQGYSTSGNYFNFRIVDGRKYSHTLDPFTGFPAQRAVLCVTVFAKDCSTADAWATAFMSMGHEKGIELLKSHPELEAFFVYSTPEGIRHYTSPGLADALTVAQ